MAEMLLEVKSAQKNFGGIAACDNVSLQVERGGIVGLIGPNGSGKSTLFNLICGAIPADGGRIVFAGKDITASSSAKIARAGLVRTFQQTRVYREMTCMDCMRISAPAARWLSPPPKAAEDEAAELLAFVGLESKREELAGALSFGQQKLLELAMALVARPKMLLLDEPTAGINPTLINGVLARLRAVNEQFGITLLVIEHNMRVIMNLARRIYCLAHGRMLAEGAAAEIQKDARVIGAYLGKR
ncbi:MAG: ABC transporter ATP-binding protein [Betaproteobacteria bacterium]|nr:ABC transporter ATP-binding protein [Betaproteobacteria bacterium]